MTTWPTVRLIGVRTVEDSSPRTAGWPQGRSRPAAAAAPVGPRPQHQRAAVRSSWPGPGRADHHPDTRTPARRRDHRPDQSAPGGGGGGGKKPGRDAGHRRRRRPATVVTGRLPPDHRAVRTRLTRPGGRTRPRSSSCAGAADHTWPGCIHCSTTPNGASSLIVVGGVAPARWSVRMALGEPDSDVR